MKTKSIDIQAKEWFDKVNGNSYFAGTITLNFGTETEETFLIPFQYGYGSQYEQEAKAILTQFNKISTEPFESLSTYCHRVGIKLNRSIQRGCLKRDLKAIETQYNEQLETTM